VHSCSQLLGPRKGQALSFIRDVNEGQLGLPPTDQVTINDSFTHSLYRIKVPSGGQKTPVTTKDSESSEKVTEKVVADRKFVIEAAIVRILKTRRRISHQDLIKEVFEQCKFSLEAADVKGRVETLIDREFIARDKEPGVYVYVA
jgi:cullin-4